MNKSQSPKISIIVPVYNTSDYLADCLDSIAAQTFKDFEVLMVNDGSTDNSATICDKYQIIDNRFRLIQQSNSGISAARNKGIDEAKGEYIAFIDSDDIVRNNYLSELICNMDENTQIVQCSYSRFTECLLPQQCADTQEYIVWGGVAFKSCLKGTKLSSVVWDKLYRIELFNTLGSEIRFPIGHTMEDAYILSDLYAIKRPNIRIVADDLYLYRIRKGSIMTQILTSKFMEYSFKQYEHRIKLSEKYYPDLIALSESQLSSDFLQYYRLIGIGRVLDENRARKNCYRTLFKWQKKYSKRIRPFKIKILLTVLRYMPALAKYL